mgnify:CR=1 FL=1
MENSLTGLQEAVIQFLTEDGYNRKFFLSQIDELVASDAEHFFSKMLAIFVHLEFDEEEAKLHWERIMLNCRQLSLQTGREVGLRVAILDYFLNINRLLNNPMLVEIHLFKQTERLAMTDGLTGLFNQRYFDINLGKEVRRALRYRKDLSVAIIDLDNFKQLNDTRGHVFGDLVLKRFGEILMSTSREEDIVCRYGGEEFVLLLPEVSTSGTIHLLERVREKIHSTPFFSEHRITFSAGVACFPTHYDEEDALSIVRAADRALYQAKYEGKDRIIEYFAEKRRHTRFKQSWRISWERVNAGSQEPASRDSIITQNVSLGGVRFESSDWLSLDEDLLVSISQSGEHDSGGIAIRIPGRVIWTRRLSENRLAYGVAFLDLNPDQRQHLGGALPVSRFLNDMP